jgi:hypothetical protein
MFPSGTLMAVYFGRKLVLNEHKSRHEHGFSCCFPFHSRGLTCMVVFTFGTYYRVSACTTCPQGTNAMAWYGMVDHRSFQNNDYYWHVSHTHTQ